MKTLVCWASEMDVPCFYIVEDRPVPAEFHNAFINVDGEIGDRINDFFFTPEGAERYDKVIGPQTGYFDQIIITGQL